MRIRPTKPPRVLFVEPKGRPRAMKSASTTSWWPVQIQSARLPDHGPGIFLLAALTSNDPGMNTFEAQAFKSHPHCVLGQTWSRHAA